MEVPGAAAAEGSDAGDGRLRRAGRPLPGWRCV